MSDAVHVTIDDLLFVIGPNTSNVSNLNVSNSLFTYCVGLFVKPEGL
jgi:hypothetical protein